MCFVGLLDQKGQAGMGGGRRIRVFYSMPSARKLLNVATYCAVLLFPKCSCSRVSALCCSLILDRYRDFHIVSQLGKIERVYALRAASPPG
jgi:hypothetical protein